LKDEVVVITGASAGLGRATAREFGRQGAKVGLKAQPVPPIFQPEVGARAIYWAAHHSRREIYTGWPTVEAIVGNKIAPGLLDRYLGKTGFDSQQTSEPEDPDRPNNLWKPMQGDHGAHGTFGDRASETSWELRASLDRRWIGAGVAAIAAVLLATRRW